MGFFGPTKTVGKDQNPMKIIIFLNFLDLGLVF